MLKQPYFNLSLQIIMLKSILKAFLLILSGTGIKASTKSDLTSLEWKNRLVIVNIKKVLCLFLLSYLVVCTLF